MRMWMVDPALLCDKHLLGEHGEIHKFRHNFVKGHSIKNRMSPVVQIEPFKMEKRHDKLAEEMLRRGMNHDSIYFLPDLKQYREYAHKKVDINYNLKDLKERCEVCKANFIP